MNKITQERIARGEGQRQQKIAFATYWTTMALLANTPEEKRDAMATALRHIHTMDELTETICTLIREG